MNAKRVVLAGGSGFLGQELARHLSARGYEIVVLTRSPDKHVSVAKFVAWDGKTLGDWATHLDGAAAVVNLTGKSVNCRYTPENCREINESRVDSVNVIAQAIARCAVPPAVWVQAASLAIYGDAGERICNEDTPHGDGFPVETCLLWEGAFNSAQTPRTRKVLLRIGFALGRDGGALGTLARLTRWFLGGAIGSGQQFISWLHIADLNRMFEWAIERSDIAGVFNATGPNPVPNAEFMRQLRNTMRRPWSPPTPVWAVHMGAWLMGTEACLALRGWRAVPKRFLENGFEFEFPDLSESLQDIYSTQKSRCV